MREQTEIFKINGNPVLVPDDVSVNYEDLISSDSGRDESGVMHRIALRKNMATWKLSYSYLSEEEKQYMESLFPDSATFEFGYPSRTDAAVTELAECYRNKYGVTWKNAKTGLWSGYSITIVQC